MSAARLWAKALLRTRWPVSIALAVFAGLAGGVTMTVWEAARRASTVVDRWERHVAPATGLAEGCPAGIDPEGDISACFAPEMLERVWRPLSESPLVSGAEVTGFLPVLVSSPSSPDVVFDGVVGHAPFESGVIERPVVVEGRVPGDTATDELALTPTAAERLGVSPGDDVALQICSWTFDGGDPDCAPAGPFHVVGLVQTLDGLAEERPDPPGSTVDSIGGGVLVGAGGWSALSRDRFPYGEVEFRTQPGATPEDVADHLSAALPDDLTTAYPDPELERIASLRRSVSLQSDGLVVLTVAMAVMALVFVAQALIAQVRRETTQRATVRALGAPRSLLVATVALRTVVIAMAAAVIAVVVALLASGIGPRGLAGRVEPDRGVRVDGTVLAVGGVVVAIGVMASACLGAWLPDRRRSLARAGRVARWASAAPVPVRSGLSMASLGRRHVLWPALVSVTAAVGVLVAAYTMRHNLNETFTDPRAYGATWDYTVASQNSGGLVTEEQVAAADEAVAGDPTITAAAYLRSAGPYEVPGATPFGVVAFDSVKGFIGAELLSGRLPATPDEVAVGPRTLDELNLSVGDDFPVLQGSQFDEATGELNVISIGPLRIVGRVIVDDDDTIGPGKGIVLTAEGMTLLEPAGGRTLVVTTDHSRPPIEEVAHFTEQFGQGVELPFPQADVTNLRLVQAIPLVIAGFVAFLAIVVLLHALVTCVQRSRKQCATFRALGLTSGQITRSVLALTAVVLVPATVVGLAIGFVGGAWGWRLVADEIGLRPGAQAAIGAGLLAAVVAVAAGLVVAMWPAWMARRRTGALSLRTE